MFKYAFGADKSQKCDKYKILTKNIEIKVPKINKMN